MVTKRYNARRVPRGLEDLDVLVAISKGAYWLKLKKLRALGFIKGRIPQLEITEDGVTEIARMTRGGPGPVR